MDRIAFEIGPIPVNWFGIFVAVAFIAGLWTASRRAMRDGFTPEQILDAGPWLIVGSIVGARLLYVVTYWNQDFAGQPWVKVFNIRAGGLVFYGGLIGATLAVLIYLRWKKLPVWKFGDALAPSISLGHIFGRMGCLMNGCCYGKPTSLPWAIRFPDDHETHGATVHPTQIYEAALSLALYGALAWLYRRKKFDGQVFALYLVGYAILRSTVEVFRGDYPIRHFGGLISPGQLVSIGIFAAGVVLFMLLKRARKTAPEPPRDAHERRAG